MAKVVKIWAISKYVLQIDANELVEEKILILKNGNVVPLNNFSKLDLGGFLITLKEEIVLGNHYQLKYGDEMTDIDLTNFVDFEDFDQKYYSNESLGAIVENDNTTFRLFAPLAYEVKVFVGNNNDVWQEFLMKRHDNGTFEINLNQNLHGYKYYYQIKQNGNKVKVNDPYCLSLTKSKEYSVVVDKSKFSQTPNYSLPPIDKYVDAIIYETSVRDFTIYPDSEIENKGSFSGFIEANKRYLNQPIGLDYLLKLKVTHVQLLPVFSFYGVNDDNILKTYNWGYNPLYYFALEGSLSSKVDDSLYRIEEFKTLVNTLHNHGIRVNMDVVFNHVYEYSQSAYELILPRYYFRHHGEAMSNGSFCGDDLETKRPMVRKLIVDALKFFVEFYDIDGFRFDLMGIIDIETCQQIYEELSRIKKDIMLYGEGWNMPTFLLDEEKSIIANANKLPHYAFFNDFFRDVVKGNNFERGNRGYVLGENNLFENFKLAFQGIYHHFFNDANQSINYIECHDNMTLYDKISCVLTNLSDSEVLKVVKLCNAINVLSFGIPFLHMGQEIGLTKFKEDNTYNMGDKYNQFDFSLLAKRSSMLNYTADLIQLRKTYSFFHLYNYKDITNMVKFENISNMGNKITYKVDDKEYSLIFNTSTENNIYYNFNETQRIIFNEAGLLKKPAYVQSLILSPMSLVFVVNKL